MQRPDGPASGYQNWRDLLFAHWTFDPSVVRALVPEHLEIDLWEDRAYVGVVPFAMENVRPALLPRVLAMDFLETNLRTYVRHRGESGVYFFSLEAASMLAVKAARWGWGLPYFHADMSMSREGDVIEYASERRGSPASRCYARYRLGRMLGASTEGTLAYWLLERYLLFTVKRDRVYRGQVHHVPYPAQEVEVLTFDEDLLAAAGLPPTDGAPPEVAHYASGVDVEVFGPYPV